MQGGLLGFAALPPYSFSFFFCKMSLIYEKAATAQDSKISLRLEKAVQHIDLVRYAPLSVLVAGLINGLPESVSFEIAHPVRERVRPCNRVDLEFIALWAQHGRGCIMEVSPAENRGNTGPDGRLSPHGADHEGLYRLRVRYYLNDLGALEILADDHAQLEIEGLVADSFYQLYSPEMPVVAATAQQYTEFETGLVLATDRERNFSTVGRAGLILPNRPDLIQRIMLTFARANGASDTKEYTIEEFMATQADINPVVLKLNYDSFQVNQRDTLDMTGDRASLFLIDFALGITNVQLDTVLGSEFRYCFVSQKQRP